MELTKYTCNEKTSTNIFSLQDIVKERLNNFEMFLNQIRRDIPNSIDTIIDNILLQYGETEDYEFQLECKHELLKQYPKLLDKSKSTILSLLNYSKYENKPINKKININFSDVIRSDVLFRYYQINSLLTIMSREKAIKFYKDLLDHLTQQKIEPKNYMDNINEKFKEWKKKAGEVWQAHDMIIGKLDENSIVAKITRCRWAEIMKELDSELSYTLACYGDFEAQKKYNPNFILTRTQTLMQGADYCDFCVHDTRFKKEIKHPSIEFWDKIC